MSNQIVALLLFLLMCASAAYYASSAIGEDDTKLDRWADMFFAILFTSMAFRALQLATGGA